MNLRNYGSLAELWFIYELREKEEVRVNEGE